MQGKSPEYDLVASIIKSLSSALGFISYFFAFNLNPKISAKLPADFT
jgi:hypothetical protein